RQRRDLVGYKSYLSRVMFLHFAGGRVTLRPLPRGESMGILAKLANLFSRSGRDDNRLLQGMEHANAKRPIQAIAVYDSLVNANGTSPTIRARALFNRALAHSAMKDDQKAIA